MSPARTTTKCGSPRLHVERVTTLNALQQIEPDWRALWDRCPAATPFQSPAWMLPWWSHLFGGGEVWTLVLRAAGSMVGLVPLFVHGVDTRRISFAGSGVTDYLDLLAEPRFAAAAAQALWQYLESESDGWEECDLQEIRTGSPLLQAAPPAHWIAHREILSRCPVLELPRRPEELEAGLAGKFRYRIRSSHRKLEGVGALEFETAAPESDAAFLDALFRLHGEHWSHRSESGVLSTETLQSFYREVAARFRERGWLRLYGMRLDGVLRAVLYVFVTRARAYYYIGGFDDALSTFSPGAVLLRYALAELIEEGVRKFDFLRGTEPHKYRWGARDQENHRLLIQKTGDHCFTPGSGCPDSRSNGSAYR